MKSYLLARSDVNIAKDELSRLLPRNKETWLLYDVHNDPIAYFHFSPDDDDAGNIAVFADISGRHFEKDRQVIDVLSALQKVAGGKILNDDGDTV